MDPQLLETLVLILHVLAGLGVIGLVLIQHGKGAEAGSGFGSGASSTVFGSSGAGNFLTKTTTWLAIAFFVTSFTLAYFAKQRSEAARDLGLPQVMEQAPATATELPGIESDTTGLEIPSAGDAEVPQSDSAIDEIPSEADVQSATSEDSTPSSEDIPQ